MSNSPAPSSSPNGGPTEPTRGPWTAVATLVAQRSGIVAIVALLVTIVLGFGTSKLEFATGQDNYLNSDSQVYQDNVAYQDLFGGQAMLSVFTVDEGKTLIDLFTPENIAQWDELQASLNENSHIAAVVTPVTALEFTNALVNGGQGSDVAALLDSPAAQILQGAAARDTPESAEVRNADSIATAGRYTAVQDQTLENPEWVEFLLYDNRGDVRKSLRPFFPNPQNAQMVVRLTGNASIDEEGEGAAAVEEAMAGRTFDNATVVTTGAAVLLRDINDYLRGGFLTLGGIALAVMAVLLLVAFAVRWRLLPLGVVAVGLVWAFGLAGYIGIPLSVVTISGMPVLLGVGIDFAVQLHARVEEEVSLDRAEHPLRETLTRLGPALLVATVAAVLSFLALEFSEVPMLRDFGLLLALGLPVIVLATVFITLASLGWRERRSPTPPKDYTHGPLARIVVRLGSLPRAVALPLVALSIAVFVGGIFAEDDLTVQTDPEKWVDQSSQVVEDIEQVRNRVGSSSELGIFVQSGDVFDDETVAFVYTYASEQLTKYEGDLLTASSLPTTVGFLMEIPDAEIVPPNSSDVVAAFNVTPCDIRVSTVSIDGLDRDALCEAELTVGAEQPGALNLIFRQAAGPLEERAVVVNEIRDTVSPPAGVTATPSGLAVVGVGLLDNFQANRTELTYYALAAVFVFLLLRYLNVARALLSMVPVLIAVGLASLISWAAGFELSPLTAVGGPLVIALCTEFTTLLIMRYIEERRRDHDPREAVDVTAARTGRAFMVSAMAAVIGILVLAASSLPLLRDFGLVVALNVFVALLSALVVLPPLLVWADEKGWVYRARQPAGPTPAPTPTSPANPAPPASPSDKTIT